LIELLNYCTMATEGESKDVEMADAEAEEEVRQWLRAAVSDRLLVDAQASRLRF